MGGLCCIYSVLYFSSLKVSKQTMNLDELIRELQDYVHWLNYVPIYVTLEYMSPI